MSSLCYKCEKEIDDDDDYATCDSCDSVFHIKCANITKKEINARKNSKCLRLYCPDCFKFKSNGTAEKLKEVLKMLYKLDLFNQQQIEKQTTKHDFSASIESKLNDLDKKISNSTATSNTNTVNNRIAKPTYAHIVNKASVKPAIVIKPKSKQSSKKTFEEISEKINKNDLNVCGTRNVRDGGVVLCCENSSETLKAKKIVNEKLGTNYEVILPKIKAPRVRISNIASDIPNDSIINELKKHNDEIKDFEMRLITVISRKNRSSLSNDAIIEMNSESFNKILDIAVLKLPWRECLVFEHLHVKRCYKCCGFFHKSTECKQSQKCSRCAGSHKYSECKNKKNCCVNCKQANEKFKTNLDTNHHSWDKQCSIYKRRLASVKNKIEYNDAE